ncbi:MAG: heparinase II/III family protein, partial [Planctomycetota bacterium]|nr:heparinase II/III family protein [Planctomycetota bacterium]
MDWEVNENAIVDQKGAYNILGRGRVLSAMAMAYDWLYNKLSPRKRRRIRRHLDAEANRLFLYNETIVGNSSSNNWDPWIGAGYGMAGIALRDEHRWAGDWVASMKRIFRVNLHHSGEDFGYFNSGLIKSLDFGISLKTATGEDIFTAEKERLKTLLDYRTMLLEPLGERYAQFGDARGSNDPLLSLCLATCFEDPLAQWFIKHRSAGTADHMKSWAWNHMLPIAVVTLYDPLVKETGPNLPRMPLARSFANEPRLVPGVRGVTIMRTGYDRTADIQLALRCGDYGGWHGHPDQGSFVLNAYGDRMVVDFALGAPYGTPKNNFSKSALAHSGVLVDEKGQVEYSSPVFHNREAGRTGPLMHTRFIDHVMADMTVAF